MGTALTVDEWEAIAAQIQRCAAAGATAEQIIETMTRAGLAAADARLVVRTVLGEPATAAA